MILSAISDSSRPDHINQAGELSCCELLPGQTGGEAGAALALGLGINAAPAQGVLGRGNRSFIDDER